MLNPLLSLQIAPYTGVQCLEWGKPQLSSLARSFFIAIFPDAACGKMFRPYRIIMEICQADVHKKLAIHGTQKTFKVTGIISIIGIINMFIS